MVKEIPLTQGKVALVDDEDYDAVMQFKWHAHREPRKHQPDNFNVRRTITRSRENGKQKCSTVLLHRFLMPGVRQVDHKDRDGLNNQRSNLRSATESQNKANRLLSLPTATSKFHGVWWGKSNNRWVSRINHNKKSIYLGSFKDEIEAAKAYDSAASQLHGEFAQLNFPPEVQIAS